MEKTRFRMDEKDADNEVSSILDSGDDTREMPDSIDQFPTNNQPVLDIVLKEMLVSLRSSLHSDMISCVHKFDTELQSVTSRVSHIENKMGEYAATISDLVEANEGKEDDIEEIRAKMTDIEDRSRRNNLKIRGVPETVKQDLREYVSQLFKAIMHVMTELEFTVDRIHRLPKPTYLSDNVPRDVILRMHFYHAKERLMTASRKGDQIPSPHNNLQFYADLSQYTLQKRRNFNTITKALRNHKLSYKRGIPTKLIVTKEGTEYVMDSVTKGIALLKTWGIIPEPPMHPRQRSKNQSPKPEWRTVDQKNARTHK